jgi:lipopolysaccharide transport system ATP-binding protein
MGDIAKAGRTVLFVSHNMAAVQNLCTLGIVLFGGEVQYLGTQSEAISRYLKKQTGPFSTLESHTDREGNGAVRVHAIRFVNSEGTEINAAVSGQTVGIRLYFRSRDRPPLSRAIASISVKTSWKALFSCTTTA